MYLLENLTKLLSRFRYPFSLPEEVATALGIHLANSLAFEEFIRLLGTPECRPTRLRKFMHRSKAEAAFQTAPKKETFATMSLFSYYFNRGWLVFALYFDEQGRLRRLYVQYPALQNSDGFEIQLLEEFQTTCSKDNGLCDSRFAPVST